MDQVTTTTEATNTAAPATEAAPLTSSFGEKLMQHLASQEAPETVATATSEAVDTKEAPAGATVATDEKDAVAELAATRERFELLTKAEKKAREKRERFEAERKAFEEEKARYLNREELERLAKEDPFKLLEQFGTKPDDAVKRYLSNDGKDPAYQIEQLKAELSKLRDELQETGKSAEKTKLEILEEQNKAKVTEYQQYIKGHISKNAEKYSLTADLPNYETQIFQAAMEIGQKTGTVPPIDEVASKFEEHLQKIYEAELNRPSVRKFVESRLKPAAPAPVKEPAEPRITLSNQFPSAAPEPKAAEPVFESDQQRLQAAIAAFQMASQRKG
jgi:hypothetical protein